MRYQHICASHATEIQFNEFAALEFWNRSMHQGISTYAHCRWDCASSYLAAALEIASIRLGISNNNHFNILHLLKPAEFLLEIHIFEKSFYKGVELLRSTVNLMERCQLDQTNVAIFALHKLAQKLRNSIGHWSSDDSEEKQKLMLSCDDLLKPSGEQTMH